MSNNEQKLKYTYIRVIIRPSLRRMKKYIKLNAETCL